MNDIKWKTFCSSWKQSFFFLSALDIFLSIVWHCVRYSLQCASKVVMSSANLAASLENAPSMIVYWFFKVAHVMPMVLKGVNNQWVWGTERKNPRSESDVNFRDFISLKKFCMAMLFFCSRTLICSYVLKRRLVKRKRTKILLCLFNSSPQDIRTWPKCRKNGVYNLLRRLVCRWVCRRHFLMGMIWNDSLSLFSFRYLFNCSISRGIWLFDLCHWNMFSVTVSNLNQLLLSHIRYLAIAMDLQFCPWNWR